MAAHTPGCCCYHAAWLSGWPPGGRRWRMRSRTADAVPRRVRVLCRVRVRVLCQVRVLCRVQVRVRVRLWRPVQVRRRARMPHGPACCCYLAFLDGGQFALFAVIRGKLSQGAEGNASK